MAKARKQQRIQTQNCRGQGEHGQHGQIFAQHHTRKANGQRIQQLIRLLPLFFRHGAHGEHWHGDEIQKTDGVQHIFEICIRARQVIHHRVNSREQQHKGDEQIAGHAVKIGAPFALKHRYHPLPAPFAPSGAVNSRYTSSRLARVRRISTMGMPACANA